MKKKFIAVFCVVLIIILTLIFTCNSNTILKSLENIKNTYSEEEIYSEKSINNSKIGAKAIIASSQVTKRITGTGPFDEATTTDSQNSDASITWTAGNDTDENDNIVRSFDEISWTLENTMELKSGTTEKYLTGGVIEITVTLPEDCKNLVEWELDKMAWAEEVEISEGQTMFTAKYEMPESDKTVPAKHNLVFTLKVLGASNGLEIKPTFTVNLQGNQESEKKKITDSEVIVSAAPKYNVELYKNQNCNRRTTLDYGEGEKAGRIIGYVILLQLYNDSEEKGLKGIEYPQGDITLDVNMKMERKDSGSTEYIDITDESLPILWNYKINHGTPVYSNRDMKFGGNYDNCQYKPAGTTAVANRNSNIFDSGKIEMNQNDSTINVKISDYSFDGVFPIYNYEYQIGQEAVYGENIGCFHSSYFQIFVPDTEANSIDTSKYNFTVTELNFSATTSSGTKTTNQQVITDDSITMEYRREIKGTYGHHFDLTANDNIINMGRKGDTTLTTGETFNIDTYIDLNPSTDANAYSVNKLIKFDGKAFEPVLTNGFQKTATGVLYRKYGNMTFKFYYLTKIDGSNWTDDTELNNTNDINSFKIYKSLENIPEGHFCIGVFVVSAGENEKENLTAQYNSIKIPMKVKETAPTNRVYGLMHTTWVWDAEDKLDRSIYCVNEESMTYPTTPKATYTASGKLVKTEYDENGNITRQNSYINGTSILVIDAREEVSVESLDEDGNKKASFDLGKLENIVKYKITPTLSIGEESTKKDNITVTIKDILPNGLTYISGSCNYGEPTSQTKDEDGNTILIWNIENCVTGEKIESLEFNASIYEDTTNNLKYNNTVIISSEQIQSNLESTRIATNSIQIINLASYILYNSTTTPLIEINEDAQINIVSINKTDVAINDFQLLDILPYNGDIRGTTFSGNYNIGKIEIIQTNITTGEIVQNNNLRLYVTEDESVRSGVSAKDENLGTSDIWNNMNSRTAIEITNAPITAFAITGTLDAKTKVEVKMYMQIEGNKQGDVYCNSVTAQINKGTELLSSSVISIQSIKRILEGKVWFDANKNGTLDSEEGFVEGIKVTLLNENETIAKNINGEEIAPVTTDGNGYYSFENLAKGNYKVKVEVTDDEKEITLKQNDNKFNTNGITDAITGLNNLDSEIITASNIDAGIAYKNAKVIVHYYIEGTKETLADSVEINGKVKDKYITSEASSIPKYYKLVEKPSNADGIMTVNDIEVIYYYVLKDYDYVINYYKDEISEKNLLNKEEGKLKYGSTLAVNSTHVEKNRPEGYTFNNTVPSIIIGTESNVINVVYEKDIFGYTVEYYKDGILETSKTEKLSAKYGDVIKIYTDKRDYGYKLDSVENLPLTIESNVENNVIKVNYIKMNSSAKIKYKDMNTEEVIYEDIIKGKALDEITIDENHEYAIEIPDYVFVEGATIKLGEEEKTAVLKYAKKASVTVKHINQYTNEVLLEEVIDGYEGKEYSTNSKTKEELKDNYTMIENSLNTNGKMTVEPTTVTYYYLRNVEITVNHIDAKTNQVLNKEIETVLAGKNYEFKAENFENYILVKEPANSKGIISQLDIVLNFEYGKVSSGVIEKHIDINSNNILYNELHEGTEVTEYIVNQKKFDGYEILTNIRYYKNNEEALIEEVLMQEYEDKEIAIEAFNQLKNNLEINSTEKLLEALNIDPTAPYIPSNYKGIMQVGSNPIEVKYYYIRKTIVTVKHVDVDTNKKILDDNGTDSVVVIQGYEGDTYTTQSKEFSKYSLIEEPENKNGIMQITTQEENISNEIVVTYKYILKSGGVEEKHIDFNSNKELDNKLYTGNIRDNYETKPKDFNGYDLLEEKYPENDKGIMKEELIEVEYYYIKQSGVNTEYIDKETGEKLREDIIIKGHEGDSYITEQQEFDGYTFIEVSGDRIGTMGSEEKTVKYYYEKIKEPIKNELSPENISDNNNSTNNILKAETVKTGDKGIKKPILTILIVVILNLSQIIISRRRKNK